MALNEIYALAAHQADRDGADPDNLTRWIRRNCTYNPEHEFFLALGIGCALADIQAVRLGYRNENHRAFEVARRSYE